MEAWHDIPPDAIDAVEDRIYGHNARATARDDAKGLCFVIRDGAGRVTGIAAGYSWADTSELKQMWIDADHRGQGHGRALLEAFLTEAARRGVRQVWVASFDFQAPEFYEKAGFTRMAEFAGWPEGHANIILRKSLNAP